MQIDSEHWLEGVRRVPSPHHTTARVQPEPGRYCTYLVASGNSAPDDIDRLFSGRLPTDLADAPVRGLWVSSRADRPAVPVRSTCRRQRACTPAFPPGKSARLQRLRIGVELGRTRTYTNAQYSTLVRLTESLFETYPRLSPEAIVGHNEVAPGRKSDPGQSFDWQRFLTSLY